MSSDNEEVLRDQLLGLACPNGHLGGYTGCDFCGCDDCNFGCRSCRGRVNENLASFLEEAEMEKYDIVSHFRYLSVSMQIFVQTLTGETITLDVMFDVTVEDLKGMIEPIAEIPPDNQRIIFGSEALEDEKKLSDYNIQNGATLTLAVVDMETLSIKVMARDGPHIFDKVKKGYILNTVDGTLLKTERWKDSGMITILTDEGCMQAIFGHTDIDTVGKCERTDDDLLSDPRAADQGKVLYWVKQHELKLRQQ
jgi:hypothetical protein